MPATKRKITKAAPTIAPVSTLSTPAPSTAKPTSTRAPLSQTIGSTGLKQFAGLVDEEWLYKLKGSLGVRVYTEMRDNDPIIGAIIYAIEALAKQADWRIEPAKRKPRRSSSKIASLTWARRGKTS